MHLYTLLYLLASSDVALAFGFRNTVSISKDLFRLPSYSAVKRVEVSSLARREEQGRGRGRRGVQEDDDSSRDDGDKGDYQGNGQNGGQGGGQFGGQFGGQCPEIWTSIYQELTAAYTEDGQCNNDARAVIRLAFHDCFSGGKCDGSIILANECSRPENRGLMDICGKIGALAKARGVGVADLIQFAGATATVVCPLGPRIPVYVGRKDSSNPSPEGGLPKLTDSADSLVAQFVAKGFTAEDLVALVGAHSTAKQFNVDKSKAGAALDTTPGVWDVASYGETITGKAPFTLESDKKLANGDSTSKVWKKFAASQFGWAAAYVPAMSKMSLLGVEGGAASLTDCSYVIRGRTRPRDVKVGEINGRSV